MSLYIWLTCFMASKLRLTCDLLVNLSIAPYNMDVVNIYTLNCSDQSDSNILLLSGLPLVSSPIKDMLVGKALGDASVTTGYKGVGFKIEHSIKAEDYVRHQWDILNKAGITLTPIKTFSRKDGSTS